MKETKMILSLGILQAQVADGFYRSGQQTKALAYAEEATETCRSIEDYQMMTAAIDIAAGATRLLGRPDEALKKQQESYMIGIEQNDSLIIVRSLFNQSIAFQDLGKHYEAIKLLRSVIEVEDIEHNGRGVKGLAYYHLTNALRTIGDNEGAYQATRSGLELVGTDFPTIRIRLFASRVFSLSI